MAKTFKVHIHRYDADKDPAAYVQTYELLHDANGTVLEVLVRIRETLDDTLAFRSACEAAKCGSCAVRLNGRPVLACRTIIDGGDLDIRPLPNFPVVRDLIVDRERYETGFVRMLSYETGAEKGEAAPAVLPESRIDYANLSRCIGCLICNAACPVAAEMADAFPSPAVIAEVLSAGVRTKKGDRAGAPVAENIDSCSLCLNCHTFCPSGVLLNRINTTAKSAQVDERGARLRDKLLGRPELSGKIASRFPSLSNAALANPLIRSGMESMVGISKQADMIPYAPSLNAWLEGRKSAKPPSPSGRIVYFVGCYTRYNDSDPGKDAVALLEDLGFEVEVPKQHCCGLPLIAGGDMDAAVKLARQNTASLNAWREKGYDIVASCTSCSLMLKHEYGEVLEIDGADRLKDRVYDLGEYLRRLLETEAISLDLKPVPARAAYHAPCHLKTQRIGLPFVDILQTIPEFTVDVMDVPCCGQSGSYGFKAEKYDVSKKIGKTLSASLADLNPDIALSECGPCQVRMHGVSGRRVAHPVSILRQALTPRGA